MFSLFAVLLQAVDPSTLDLASASKLLMDAIVNRNWWLVAGLAVWLLVTLVRQYGGAIPFVGRFLAQKWSGPFLAALFSAAGALLTALLSGEGLTLKLIFAMVGAAASAVFTQEVQQKAREAAVAASDRIQSAEGADRFFFNKKE